MISSSRIAGVAALEMARFSSERVRLISRWLRMAFARRDMMAVPFGYFGIETFDIETIAFNARAAGLFRCADTPITVEGPRRGWRLICEGKRNL